MINLKKWKENLNGVFDIEKPSGRLLMILLLADLGFMLIHIFLYKIMHLGGDPLLSIIVDKGYSEIYQYIKEYWIAILLLILAVKRKHLIYFSWSLMFFYLLLDDSAQIHENIGGYIVKQYDIQPLFGLRAQDLGELGVSLFFGGVLFSFILISYFFSNSLEKKISKHLFILVMVLAFFGVIVDMLHMALLPFLEMWGNAIFGLIEDGGEMIIISIILWNVFILNYSSIKPKISE